MKDASSPRATPATAIMIDPDKITADALIALPQSTFG
jgi:hypothetical protein